MYPLHDNDLDRLSREAAEHFEVEPGASGWEHLERRLDQELPQEKKKRRFLFWLFLITATTGGALIGIMKYKPVTPLAKDNISRVTTPAEKPSSVQQNNETNATPVGSEKNNPATATYSTPVGPSQTTGNTTANTQPVAGNQQQPSASLTDPKPSTTGNNQPGTASTLVTTPDKNAIKPVVKTSNRKSNPVANEPGVDKTPLTLNYATITPQTRGKDGRQSTKASKRKPGQRQRTTAGKNSQIVNTVPDNTTEPDNKIATIDQDTNGEPADKNTDPSVTSSTTQPATNSMLADAEKNNNTVTPPAADSTKTLAEQPTKKEAGRGKDKIKQPLEIGLMAGPDLSTVKFGPMYKTGYIFGLQVGYRFSNRWSVNTGVIYTKKFYKADGEDFHYKNQWNWEIDNAEGNCSMWEIPVNVRYDFSFNTKRRWFASAGASTYLMDKEYYMINYNVNGNIYPYPYNTDTNKNYFFSILNLSGGMERSLGKRFSLQAEPYLKIPLQGLGTGSIRMDSYGILFTLKYKPVFNSKK
ncbi:hypothetical protein FAM09_00960 [Niastella caeni]|uniref:Outer membrane protein beta-barrel domain-containing protein n=1 Tax=Niastella caeni TaxID=2569763 RepID=A0A4S8HYV5_9BACT|nr:porin family protein [Niastella caeni]THU40715.1 hypothetical protein FAM09_00960 [Niastella caeni]